MQKKVSDIYSTKKKERKKQATCLYPTNITSIYLNKIASPDFEKENFTISNTAIFISSRCANEETKQLYTVLGLKAFNIPQNSEK